MMFAIPIKVADAHKFVNQHHRHHRGLSPWQSRMQDLFAIGTVKNSELCGVVIVSRPCSRFVEDGETAEVSRLCTDGTKNACSFLYSRAARAVEAMGYSRIVTYILFEDEPGTSLKASGWEVTLSRTDKRGNNRHGAVDGKSKVRWEKRFRNPVGNVDVFVKTPERVHGTIDLFAE